MSNPNFDKLDRIAKNSKDWTLQNDLELKNILQEYSNNLIKTTEGLNEATQKLNENINKIDVRLGNVYNRLNYTKMTRLVEEKVDDISLVSLVQRNQRNVTEKKAQTKEEFEQQTIRTISSSIIKAFQKISETNIPISEGFLTSDPLDPCSSSQKQNSDFNKEIENPFVKMCKFPPIIGSKESFNYLRRGADLNENTSNVSNFEKSSRQISSLKDEDIQSTSSGRSIPPQDPIAGLNQTKTLLDQMVIKMAEKAREFGIEQGNSEHSSLSQGLSLENAGKTSATSPSLSSTSYETSISSRPNGKIQKSENIHSIEEKTSEKSSIHSSKQFNSIKSPITKEREEELFSSTESDDYDDNTSIFSSNTKKSMNSGIYNEQQKVINIPKVNERNVLIQQSLKTTENQVISQPEPKPLNNQLNSFKQNQPSKDQFTSSKNQVSIQNNKEDSKNDEFSSVSVKGLIAQIGNKIPIGRPDEKNKKEINQKEEEEKAQISTEQLEILKGRVKGPAARRAPSNLNVKLQKNNLDENETNSKLNEGINKELSKKNILKELEGSKNTEKGHEPLKKLESLKEVPKITKEVENSKETLKPLKQKEEPKIILKNTQTLKSIAISKTQNNQKIKKGLSIFSSSSDDDFDLNINNKKSLKEEQPKQSLFKQKVENIEEKKQQNVEKQKLKKDITKQRKGLFDDSDSDF